MTQRTAVIPYPRFGATYRSHLQEELLTLEDGTDSCPETSVNKYQYTYYSPEERSSLLLRGGSLRSLIDLLRSS